MAQIDTSELLVDPDFVDPISVIVRTSTVNSRGENTMEEQWAHTFGSVQPISGKDLMRLPESLRMENVSSFWMKGCVPLTDNEAYPSIFVFNGKRFAVRKLMSWNNWGAGFVEGICIAEKPDGS